MAELQPVAKVICQYPCLGKKAGESQGENDQKSQAEQKPAVIRAGRRRIKWIKTRTGCQTVKPPGL